MSDEFIGALQAVANVILFALVNALWVKPETAGQWIGMAIAWSAGILIVAVAKERSRDPR